MSTKSTWWDAIKASVAYPLSTHPISPKKIDTFKLIQGFFVASEIDWENVISEMREKKYDAKDKNGQSITTGKMVSYPNIIFEKSFYTNEVCEAIIQLKTKAMSEAEIKSYVPHYLLKNKVLADTGKNVGAWLKKKTGESAFYDFVEFTIYCSIDINKYNESNVGKVDSAKTLEVKKILHTKFFEWIAEKYVYTDFYDSVNEIQTVSKTTAETNLTETKKEDTTIGSRNTLKEKAEFKEFSKQKVSPFAYYLPKNDVEFEIAPGTYPVNFKLNKKLVLSSEMLSGTAAKPEISLALREYLKSSGSGSATGSKSPTLRYKLVLESNYFSFDPEIIDIGKGKKCEATVSPLIEKITAEERDESGYTVNVKLIDTIYAVTYPAKQIKIKLSPPDLLIQLERPNLPHKGYPINLKFKVKGSDIDVKLPVTLKGKIGPDFIVIDPPPVEEAKKSEIQHEFNISPKKSEEEKCYTLKAQRAGHWPWFRNQASLQFSVGKWKFPMKQKEFSVAGRKFGWLREGDWWEMRMNVFPSWFDTAVLAFAGVYSLLLLSFPGFLPPLAAELNPSTIVLPSSVIYLAYRIINWGRKLQSESK